MCSCRYGKGLLVASEGGRCDVIGRNNSSSLHCGIRAVLVTPQLFPHPLPFDWKDFPMGKWGCVAKRELEMVWNFFQSSNWLSPPYIYFSNGTENLTKVPCSNACPMTPFCHKGPFLTPTHEDTSITEVGTCVHVCICLKKKIYTFTISDDTGWRALCYDLIWPPLWCTGAEDNFSAEHLFLFVLFNIINLQCYEFQACNVMIQQWFRYAM